MADGLAVPQVILTARRQADGRCSISAMGVETKSELATVLRAAVYEFVALAANGASRPGTVTACGEVQEPERVALIDGDGRGAIMAVRTLPTAAIRPFLIRLSGSAHKLIEVPVWGTVQGGDVVFFAPRNPRCRLGYYIDQ